jgi:hypothetical protein
MKLYQLPRLATLTVLALLSANVARAAYDYNISGNTGEFISDVGVKVDTTTIPAGSFYCGGIQIRPAVSGDSHGANYTPGLGTVPGYTAFSTVCVDLEGEIYVNHNYTFNTVAFSGQTGLNPQWGVPSGASGAALQAIENAAWLFANHQGITSAKDWAALQLAVWDVIYNTDGTGAVTGNRFQVTHADSEGAWTEAQNWIAALQSTGRTKNYVGYLLQPTDRTAQELFVNVTPVPEPSTAIAAALLLLPLAGIGLKRSGGWRSGRPWTSVKESAGK